jgi:stringent starvation protein B
MKVPTTFPVIVKSSSSVVKIYRSKTKGYLEFKVAYYDSTRHRKTTTFSSYEDTRKAADRVVESLSSGNVEALSLTNEDRMIYLRAQSVLQSIQIPLDIAAAEFAKAKGLLGEGSLLEAVRVYVKGHRSLQAKTVGEIVEELIHEKENNRNRPASEDYIRDLRSHLGWTDTKESATRGMVRNILN